MPWFKVDDNLAFHSKTVAAGNAAMGLWVRAGSWCAQQLTDGVVPAHIASMFGTPQQAAKLVKVGLWHEVSGGFSFHEWDERQPKREAIEGERAAARERMRERRDRKTGRMSASSQVSDTGSVEHLRTGPDVFAHPDPTRPDPTLSKRVTTSLSRRTATVSDRFDEFWDAYPRKVGKATARTKYTAAVKRASEDDVIDGAHRLAADPNLPDAQYIPHPATWLGRDGWNDEPLPSRRPANRSRATERRDRNREAIRQVAIRDGVLPPDPLPLQIGHRP